MHLNISINFALFELREQYSQNGLFLLLNLIWMIYIYIYINDIYIYIYIYKIYCSLHVYQTIRTPNKNSRTECSQFSSDANEDQLNRAAICRVTP